MATKVHIRRTPRVQGVKIGPGFLNYVFDTYKSCRPFLKGMHIALDYWQPYRNSKVWKQDPYVMDNDLTDDNLG